MGRPREQDEAAHADALIRERDCLHSKRQERFGDAKERLIMSEQLRRGRVRDRKEKRECVSVTEERRDKPGKDEVSLLLAGRKVSQRKRGFRACPFRAGRPHKPGRGLIFTVERTRLDTARDQGFNLFSRSVCWRQSEYDGRAEKHTQKKGEPGTDLDCVEMNLVATDSLIR